MATPQQNFAGGSCFIPSSDSPKTVHRFSRISNPVGFPFTPLVRELMRQTLARCISAILSPGIGPQDWSHLGYEVDWVDLMSVPPMALPSVRGRGSLRKAELVRALAAALWPAPGAWRGVGALGHLARKRRGKPNSRASWPKHGLL